ncbi:MAG: sigma-54-dependent transcriptional regulator [Emergencia sp.]
MVKVLLIDDDIKLLEVYERIFELKGFDVVACSSAMDAIEAMKKDSFSVVVSDIIMPKMNGMRLLEFVKGNYPGTEVIMLTAEGSIQGAVDAVKKGAFSYVVKPADIDELISMIKKAAELSTVKSENTLLKEQLQDANGERVFITASEAGKRVYEMACKIGKTESSVHITGETGTGKEIIAHTIHMNSSRADKPFICVNCGALNENLIENELFGSEKGAYTGAEKQHIGKFEAANGGTIFLDEIGELSLNMQIRLLRVLQEKEFNRVGGVATVKSDFRLITATNRDLKQAIKDNLFRDDLYYRISIVPIDIPPLRERKADIKPLCDYFVNYYSNELKKRIAPLDDDILHIFQSYDWPGNVRELRNIIERMVVLAENGVLPVSCIPEEILSSSGAYVEESLKGKTRAFEKQYITGVLEKHGGNVAKAAEEMQIAKKNLYRKLNDYDIKYKKSDIE